MQRNHAVHLLNPHDLDQYAWHAVSNWHHHTEESVYYKSLDFSILTQSFLSGIVARALRNITDPLQFHKEQELESHGYETFKQQKRNTLLPLRLLRLTTDYAHNLISTTIATSQRNTFEPAPKPTLFLPHIKVGTGLLANVTESIRRDPSVKIVDATFCLPERTLFQWNIRRISQADLLFARKLYGAILTGLKAMNIDLLDNDKLFLENKIIRQLQYINICEKELRIIRPAAILSLAHRSHPGIEYCLLGLRDHIPVIIFPHGLDCLRVFLDHVYAPYVAVWGLARKKIFKETSAYQPSKIEVCGAPHLDRLRLPTEITFAGQYWLWIPRPHVALRCQKPSQSPLEGIDILETLLKKLEEVNTASLVIKPHPGGEYQGAFTKIISKSPASARVRLSSENLLTLLPSANLVIAEDTTGGMDAMFFGKILIFAHFSKTDASLPFSQSGAALGAFTKKGLEEAIDRSYKLTASELQTMLLGQQDFLNQHAGLCDGKATQRSVNFIKSVLHNHAKKKATNP